jgi:hypothetical protein
MRPRHALKALSGTCAGVPTTASRPRRLCVRIPTAPPRQPGRSPHLMRRRPRVRARHAAVYPVRRAGKYAAPPRSSVVSAALTFSAVVPRRSPSSRVPSTRRRPCTGEALPCFSPRRLLCAGEVAAAEHACRAAAHTLVLGRAGPGRGPRALRWPRPSRARLGLARCEGRLCRHCATGPRKDSAQWHLIYIFIFSEYIQVLANSTICVGFI